MRKHIANTIIELKSTAASWRMCLIIEMFFWTWQMWLKSSNTYVTFTIESNSDVFFKRNTETQTRRWYEAGLVLNLGAN